MGKIIEKLCLTLNQFKDYYLDHNYNENMFTKDGHINPKYNSKKKTGLIATILSDYWSNYYSLNKIFIIFLK